MAKVKAVDKDIEDIKKFIKEGRTVIGTNIVIKSLRTDKIEKVYLASNCNKETVDEIVHSSKLNKFSMIRLKYPNDELGVFCKKPFSISVLGIIR